MRTLTLTALLADVEARGRRAGVVLPTEEAMRNRGGNRTAAKRAMLARAAERARAAGVGAIPAYY